MAIIVGLLLVPVGAAIGTGIVLASALLAQPNPIEPQVLRMLVFFGMSFGAIFASPVTIVVLPASYAILRRRAALKLRRLALIGAVAGIFPVIAFSLVEARRTGNLHIVDGGLLTMACLAAVSGLVVGVLFALIMRRLRQTDWHVVEPRPILEKSAGLAATE